MATWLQFSIAVPCVLLIALGMWKASNALTRRGIVVRPVDLMDREMMKIERRFANLDTAAPTSPEPPSKT